VNGCGGSAVHGSELLAERCAERVDCPGQSVAAPDLVAADLRSLKEVAVLLLED
jgi:hypothetical protein